jgi:hypothetical protein
MFIAPGIEDRFEQPAKFAFCSYGCDVSFPTASPGTVLGCSDTAQMLLVRSRRNAPSDAQSSALSELTLNRNAFDTPFIPEVMRARP